MSIFYGRITHINFEKEWSMKMILWIDNNWIYNFFYRLNKWDICCDKMVKVEVLLNLEGDLS
jgi:hypothetical protein